MGVSAPSMAATPTTPASTNNAPSSPTIAGTTPTKMYTTTIIPTSSTPPLQIHTSRPSPEPVATPAAVTSAPTPIVSVQSRWFGPMDSSWSPNQTSAKPMSKVR